MRYRFRVEVHPEYGIGFRPLWYINGEPFRGMAVAHDILEHFPNDLGEIEGELLALGAGLLIRGETGYFQRNGNVLPACAHIASGVALAWGYNVKRDNRLTVKPCAAIQDSELWEKCRPIISYALRRQYFVEQGIPDPNRLVRRRMAQWIARGYKRAERRYRHIDIYTLAHRIFAHIEETADKLLHESAEGMGMVVDLNLTRMTADLTLTEGS